MSGNDDLNADVHLEPEEPAAQPVASSSGPDVYIMQTVLDEVRAHADREKHHEIGGVLLGVVVDGTHPIVMAAIAGTHMTHSKLSVTFTHESWNEINRIKDQRYPDLRIVGWYHSHPGVGIFLSGHDLFIHRNFFSAPWQIAVVVDPLAGDWGCFTWHEDELVRETEVDLQLVPSGAESEPTGPQPAASGTSAAPVTFATSAPLPTPAASPPRRSYWIDGLLVMLLTMTLVTAVTAFYDIHALVARTRALQQQVSALSAQVTELRDSQSQPSPAVPAAQPAPPGTEAPPVPPPSPSPPLTGAPGP